MHGITHLFGFLRKFYSYGCRTECFQRFGSHLLYFMNFCSELEKFLVGHRFLGQITNFNSSTRSGFIKSAQVFNGSLTRDFQLQVFFMNQFPPGPLSIPLGPIRIFVSDKHSFANISANFRILRGSWDTDS